uniref:Dapper homolog 2-like n=1 Tax=Lepisosteus oculatus TaxID=7918 RepID=W5LY43_LEPOC
MITLTAWLMGSRASARAALRDREGLWAARLSAVPLCRRPAVRTARTVAGPPSPGTPWRCPTQKRCPPTRLAPRGPPATPGPAQGSTRSVAAPCRPPAAPSAARGPGGPGLVARTPPTTAPPSGRGPDCSPPLSSRRGPRGGSGGRCPQVTWKYSAASCRSPTFAPGWGAGPQGRPPLPRTALQRPSAGTPDSRWTPSSARTWCRGRPRRCTPTPAPSTRWRCRAPCTRPAAPRTPSRMRVAGGRRCPGVPAAPALRTLLARPGQIATSASCSGGTGAGPARCCSPPWTPAPRAAGKRRACRCRPSAAAVPPPR